MGSDPNDDTSKPIYNIFLDTDQDGIPDMIDSDINSPDIDGDGYSDSEETKYHTNPFSDLETPDYGDVAIYEIKNDALLKSQTFYNIDRISGQLPQSIADYTLSYYREDEQLNFYFTHWNKSAQCFYAQFISHYKTFLMQALEADNCLVSKIPMITKSEYKKISYDWNLTNVDFP